MGKEGDLACRDTAELVLTLIPSATGTAHAACGYIVNDNHLILLLLC